MNETYVECMVPHKKSPLAGVFKYVAWGLAAVFFIAGFMFNSLFYVLAIVCALLAYFVSPMLDIEYEYLYVDKSIQIDKVMSMEKRRKVLEIDLNKMEIMAPLKSAELHSYKAQNLPYKEYSSGEAEDKVYVIVYADKENRCMVGIEPDVDMLKAIKTVFPRKVIGF